MAVVKLATVEGPKLPPVCAISGQPAELNWKINRRVNTSGRRYRLKWTIPVTRAAKKQQQWREQGRGLLLLILLFGALAPPAVLQNEDGSFTGRVVPLVLAEALLLAAAVLVAIFIKPALKISVSKDGRYVILTGAHPNYFAAVMNPQGPAQYGAPPGMGQYGAPGAPAPGGVAPRYGMPPPVGGPVGPWAGGEPPIPANLLRAQRGRMVVAYVVLGIAGVMAVVLLASVLLKDDSPQVTADTAGGTAPAHTKSAAAHVTPQALNATCLDRRSNSRAPDYVPRSKAAQAVTFVQVVGSRDTTVSDPYSLASFPGSRLDGGEISVVLCVTAQSSGSRTCIADGQAYEFTAYATFVVTARSIRTAAQITPPTTLSVSAPCPRTKPAITDASPRPPEAGAGAMTAPLLALVAAHNR